MAVTKRVRYEVLRRDNHTCRYCGGSAPDVKLTVDHVRPTALGGSDLPENLVAACQDCNAGKASTSPDSPLVADVKADDLRWNQALARVAEARAAQRKIVEKYVASFDLHWHGWVYGRDEQPLPRPANWRASIERFYELGVPMEDIHHCIRVACGNDRISPDQTFRYFAGCVWRVVDEMHEAAREAVTDP